MKTAIVLVHLGKKAFPTYGYDCIEQIRLFNEGEPIYLVLDVDCEVGDPLRLSKSDCTIVRRNELKRTFKHSFYLATNLLRFKGMGGFWLYATERFFIIEEVMKRFRLGDVVHLENDVLLYLDLGKSGDSFRSKYPELGIVRDSDTRCMASFMYIRNTNAISRLNRYIACNFFLRRKNDMQALSAYCRHKKWMQLPLVPSSYAVQFGLKNLGGEQADDGDAYSNTYPELNHAFDAASFGQYVGGIDKILSKEDTRGFINETSYVNPSKGVVHWTKDEQHRLCPHFSYGGENVALANLHIHSKELYKYRSDRTD